METNIAEQQNEGIQGRQARVRQLRYRATVSRRELKKCCYEAIARNRLADVESDAANDFLQPAVDLLAIMFRTLPANGRGGEGDNNETRESCDLRPVLQRQSTG